MKYINEKNVYNINGSRSVYILLVILSLLFGVIDFMSIIGMIASKDKEMCIICAITFSILTIVTSICSYIENRGYHLIDKIKAGKEATGSIESFVFIGGKAPYYELEISYVNEYKVPSLVKTAVTTTNAKYFLSKRDIPIYVKGEYAYYNLEELKKTGIATSYIKNTTKTCVFCNSRVDGKKKICKCCGNNYTS